MEGVEIQPHIQLTAAQTTPVVIVVGDPARAKTLASRCDSYKELAYFREYRSFYCNHKNQSFLVVSHGVGSSGCAICFTELIKNGAKVIIRAGTAGSLQPKTIKQGDVVLCNAAVREDGVTSLLVPPGFPAVADFSVVQTIKDVAKDMKAPIKLGMALTSDLFYKSTVLPSSLEVFAKAGVEIVEMEISTLFVLAKLHGIKAAAMCTVDGCPFAWDSGDYAPSGDIVSEGKSLMIDLAIATAVKLTKDH